jgi:hypothetical protein
MGFPIWFLAHNRRGLFFPILVIFGLLHKFATHLFQSATGFLPAREVFRRHFGLQCLVSSGCEDTASVVAVVLSWSAFILASPLQISAA